MSNLYNYCFSYQTDLFEVNIYEVNDKMKEFPIIIEEVKYNNEVLHIYSHDTTSNIHAKTLANERLEACKPPLVLAYLLLKYAIKLEKTKLIEAGRQYLMCTV